jgi:Saccharopine dehydrogenase NADP binding domain
MKTLLVLGATGVMGRRIVALAGRLIPDVRVLWGARRVAPGAEADSRVVDIHDASSVHRALAGVDVVINSVGPFDYDPQPLLRSCAEAGCPYVDIAETPAFIAAVERLAGELASVAVSGCSTVPGLVAVLAQRWSGLGEVRRLRILLGMGSSNPVSPTLLNSLLMPLGSRAPDGSRYYGRLVRKRLRGLPARFYGRFPSPFDDEGIRIGERVLPAPFYAGMDRAAAVHALWWAAWVVPHLSSRALSWLCRMAQPVMPLVQKFGTPIGVLSVEALDAEGRLLAEVEVRALREGLNIPALPSVWAARQLLAGKPPSGTLRLEQLVTPQQAAEWLAAEGYQVTGVDGPE